MFNLYFSFLYLVSIYLLFVYLLSRGRWKWRTWKWRTIEMSRHEIDGHEIDGPNVQAWKWRTIKMSRHEIDGHENDGHENAGHVSGVWIGLHGIDFDLAVLSSNCLLLRFQECSWSKSGTADQRSQNQTGEKENEPDKRKTITTYTTYLAALTCILPLFWKELYTAF